MATKKSANEIRGRVDGAPRCPRCPSTALKKIGAVHACVNCGGVFIPLTEQNALASALKEMADTAQLVAAHAPRKLSASTLRDRAKCPVCVEEMARVAVGSIEVDACATHGAFYDRGELVEVQRAFAQAAQAAPAAQAAEPPPPVVMDIENILKT